MPDDTFSAPSAMGVDWKALYGKLLAIFPYGRELVSTKFGDANAIRADIYDVDDKTPVALDALVFGKALVLQLSGTELGKAVLGRLDQQPARGAGLNPAWILRDPSQEDYALARTYFTEHPARAMGRPQRSEAPRQAPSAPYSPQAGQAAWGAPTQAQGAPQAPYQAPPTLSSPGGTWSPEADRPPF